MFCNGSVFNYFSNDSGAQHVIFLCFVMGAFSIIFVMIVGAQQVIFICFVMVLLLGGNIFNVFSNDSGAQHVTFICVVMGAFINIVLMIWGLNM